MFCKWVPSNWGILKQEATYFLFEIFCHFARIVWCGAVQYCVFVNSSDDHFSLCILISAQRTVVCCTRHVLSAAGVT